MVDEPLNKVQTLRCVEVCASFVAMAMQLQSLLGGQRRHDTPHVLSQDAARMAQLIADAGLHPEGGGSYEQAKTLMMKAAQRVLDSLEYA
jgi:hypothetical protein